MPIEVRQMVITSTVGESEAADKGPPLSREQLARVKAEILDECRAWFEEQLRQRQER